MNEKYDYLIVGSGLAGAVFAHEATKNGRRCLVLERRPHIGGNVYTEILENIVVHRYGAHIFHTANPAVWEYVNQFARFNHYVNCPLANYHNEIYNLPFNMNTFSRMWGVVTPAQARAKIQEQRQEITGEPRNLEEQAISMVGRDIYEKLVKEYTEKQWGRPCNELSPDVIKRLPVRFTYDNNYFTHPYQGIPIGGYTPIIKKMLSGCDVLLNQDYLLNRKHWDAMAEKVLYTGPIDAYFDHSLGRLEYRSLRFDTELLDVENYQGVAVINYTNKSTPYTRIIEHKHFEFGTQPRTVITREYPHAYEEGQEPYYPVNIPQTQEIYEKYVALARQNSNVIFLGRLAQYRYFDMDQVIAQTLDYAATELSGKKGGL